MKIIQKIHLGEAAQTKKCNIFATVGLMYFRLTLPFDLSLGQIEVWQKKFCHEFIKWGLDNACI